MRHIGCIFDLGRVRGDAEDGRATRHGLRPSGCECLAALSEGKTDPAGPELGHTADGPADVHGQSNDKGYGEREATQRSVQPSLDTAS